MQEFTTRDGKKVMLSFETWLKLVNATVSRMIFVSIYDLPDRPYRDCYDAGLNPVSYGLEIVNDNDEF